MAKLSHHYALIDFDPGNVDSVLVEPISTNVTMDETWTPSVRASVTLPTSSVPAGLDPRVATFIGLRLQQDFGDLIYAYELTNDYTPVTVSSITAAYAPNVEVGRITRDYSAPWNIFEAGLPISTVTTAYTPVTPLKLTNAGLADVWRMSDFLHSSGTFNPEPSTIFDSYLMLRKVTKDYVSGETTLELTSTEAILHDNIGSYDSDIIWTFFTTRELVNFFLSGVIGKTLVPGEGDFTYSTPYGAAWRPEQTGWDYIYEIVTAAGLVLYADEAGEWHLVETGAVTGDLTLSDTDNITTLTSVIDRNNKNFFDSATIIYSGGVLLPNQDVYTMPGSTFHKERYFDRTKLNPPGAQGAQTMVERAVTRGEIYTVEAISNYDARPRQTMTIDVTGEPVKTAIIQSVSWSLPSDRMSIDIRDLVEV